MNLLASVIAFYVGWFASAAGAARGMPWLGPVVVAGILVAYLCVVARSRQLLGLALATALLGLLVECALIALDAVRYPGKSEARFLCPAWMIALWINLGLVLPFALAWLRRRYLLAGLLGAAAGPASYAAGARLGAIELNPSAPYSLTLLAIAWGAALPALYFLSELKPCDAHPRSGETLPPETTVP